MTINELDRNNEDYTATYCPEDNKIRIYCGRVQRDTFEALRAAGYKSTPKQSCDFVAVWTPSREDIAIDMIHESDDIGDEDYSPEERAADRAERFSVYRDKRRAEAGSHADTYDAGPSAFGFQSAQKAERAASRHERHRSRALGQWSKAEYWQTRTQGVISNALYKSSPSVRRGRILRLEKEQRKHAANIEHSRKHWEGWQTVANMPGADELLPLTEAGYIDAAKANDAGKLAYKLANYQSPYKNLTHPNADEANAKVRELWRHGFGPYELLGEGNFAGVEFERLTPRQVAELIAAKYREPERVGSMSWRWSEHYRLRIAYENQMIGEQGGKASELEIIPGGFFGKYQVERVHKSTATKRVTSVSVLAPSSANYDKNGKGYGPDNPRPLTLQRINIERLGESAYRAPTAEELEAFNARTKAAKKAAKAKTPAKPQLINPTDADAERLQAILNENRKGCGLDGEPREVYRMTQAVYSANSKGSYAACETEGITERLEIYKPSYFGGENQPGQVVVFKVRLYRGRVIILTDKPQKPLPFERCAEIEAGHPSFLEMVGKLEWFASERAGIRHKDQLSDEAAKVFAELRYHGLAFTSTYTDWGLSKTGQKWLNAVKCLAGDITAGHAWGLLDEDGNATPEFLEMASQLEPGLTGFDASGKTYDGLAVAAAR